MNELFKINDKTIYNIDTTVLYTSSYSYTDDAIYLINHNCIVITKERGIDSYELSDEIYAFFKEEELKNKKDLTELDYLKLKILSTLNKDDQVFVFFNVLTYLNQEFNEKLIAYLKQSQKRIINYTTEIEETLWLDYLIVIHEKEVIMEGKKEAVLQEEKILKKLGFSLPFIVELSKGLKYYQVVDKIYFNNVELVNDLWK